MTYDVLIVGAGLAGLSAAHTLCHVGRKVCLFEASSHLGGRVLSLSLSKGTTYQAGASSLQGEDVQMMNPLHAILARHHIQTKPLNTLQAEAFDTKGQKVSLPKLHASLEPEYSKALSLIQEAKKIHWQTPPTLAEILGYRDPNIPIPAVDSAAYWARKFIIASLTSHTGAPLEEVSLLELMLEEWGNDKDIVIISGTQQLIEALIQEANATSNLTTYLNTSIVKIQQDSYDRTGVQQEEIDGITVLDQAGKSYSAKSVVIAVPFSVLKHQKIQFIPELSHYKKTALSRFGVSYYNSVILEFEHVFWDKEAHYLFPNGPSIEDWPQYLNEYYCSGKNPCLIAQYAGKKARFSHRSDHIIVEEALKPLKRVYGNKMSTLKNFYVSRFDTDPNILGGSVYCSEQNRKEDFDALRKPEYGCYFAGDYIYAKSHGRLESAFESGLQAGLEVDAYLHYKEELQQHKERHLRPKF